MRSRDAAECRCWHGLCLDPGRAIGRRQNCRFVHQYAMNDNRLMNSVMRAIKGYPGPLVRERFRLAIDRKNWTLKGLARTTITLVLLGVLQSAQAATWYVDRAATGSNNGSSWGNAWTSISSASGPNVLPGDIVFISTGTYANFKPKNGASGNAITYKIGQESGHNGTVTFTGSGTWLSSPHDVIVSGDAGDGEMHFVVSGYSQIVSGTGASRWRLSYINFGTVPGSGTGTRAFDFSGHDAELDHCYIKHDNSTASSDALLLVNSDGSAAYDSGIKIHHNTMLTWTKSDGGPDIIKCAGDGISVYNNFIGTFDKTLSGTPEHPGRNPELDGGRPVPTRFTTTSSTTSKTPPSSSQLTTEDTST